MGLKPGYKRTEVGVIPEDWDVKKLRGLAQIRSGIAKNSNISVIDPVLVHYLRVANVQDGFLDLTEMRQIEISRNDLNRYAVIPGDVLMNEGGDRDKLGRGSIWSGEFNPCVHQNHVFVVRCGSSLSPHYLNTWSGAFAARRYFMVAGKQTTNLASINKTALGELPVVIPPLSEQCALATALRDMDVLLEGLETLIAKKRNLKQAAMQQLLTGQTRLPGFTGEWEVKTLGELFDFSGGYSASRDQLSSEGHCYLHYGDIHGATKTFIDATADYANIPKLDLPLSKVSPKSLLQDGDVVFVDASEDDEGTSKHVVVVNKDNVPFISGLHTIVAKSKTDEINHEYRRYCFQTKTIRDQFRFYAVGTKVSGISKTNIPRLTMPVPSSDEQAAIASVLIDMDSELDALEQRLAKTRDLKQAMMQELLTGKTRLVTSEAIHA
jgi:type I restriction enzyme S subunit